MSSDSVVASPGPGPRAVRFPDGSVHAAPDDWTLVPPGDPGLTRRFRELTAWHARRAREFERMNQGDIARTRSRRR